ncbi:hypothetical protein M419DRAFT_9286 [Trichoderma reesei RUT C-30]|uniref:Uncharacterized protein n=1 Tax=Hypocrea jecorina (strain ATCC 56765 / BCRC 32924 / NRRL 11460 / Rut C-30) TaxID=1344414 RepID=A0A024S734_HYPJR|nr:hypothetical protein M419DRAFT_9286 [Trichoderma reesei RUT C-30]
MLLPTLLCSVRSSSQIGDPGRIPFPFRRISARLESPSRCSKRRSAHRQVRPPSILVSTVLGELHHAAQPAAALVVVVVVAIVLDPTR